jgi:hypothetical protein
MTHDRELDLPCALTMPRPSACRWLHAARLRLSAASVAPSYQCRSPRRSGRERGSDVPERLFPPGSLGLLVHHRSVPSLRKQSGQGTIFPRIQGIEMVDRLKRSLDDLAAPICPLCHIEMPWFQSTMVSTDPLTIDHLFLCSNCRRTETRRALVQRPSCPPSKLSAPRLRLVK